MFLHYFLINILLSFISLFLLTWTDFSLPLTAAGDALILVIWYLLFRSKKRKPDTKILKIYLCITAIVFTLYAVLMWLNDGMAESLINMVVFVPLFPFLPLALFALFGVKQIYPLMGIILILHCLILSILIQDKRPVRQIIITALVIFISTVSSTHAYNNRGEVKYAPHGFNYMSGYSSTDFSDYMVYSDPTRLVRLDHEPDIIIEKVEDMPILDGAEACYPVYSAVAKAIYKDIDKIELEYKEENLSSKGNYLIHNGRIVTFTNTVNAYYRLVDEDCDMLFGARPSESQIQYARDNNVEFELTLIGKEAFVFFVEKDNPVDNITSDEMRAIYHGDITNWKEAGGLNQKIVAFQRPEGSGSQTMMLYFMGDVSLKEPKSYETYGPMDGIVKVVASYNNEDGALGYSFRYFIEGLMEEENVKLLAIDGVYPTVENIENGSYPLITGLYCVTRKDDPNPNVRKVIDFLLSEDGQYIIRKTGYGGINTGR